MFFFEYIYCVSELLYILIKDVLKDSFSGDYGMMLLIFFVFMLCYFGKMVGIIVFIIFVVFLFLCVMIGVYWFIDIVVGLFMVILIGFFWWLMILFSDWVIVFFENYFLGGNK